MAAAKIFGLSPTRCTISRNICGRSNANPMKFFHPEIRSFSASSVSSLACLRSDKDALSYHGAFVNVRNGHTSALPVDPIIWQRITAAPPNLIGAREQQAGKRPCDEWVVATGLC